MARTQDGIETHDSPALFGITEAGHVSGKDTETGNSCSRSYSENTPEAKNETRQEVIDTLRSMRGEYEK